MSMTFCQQCPASGCSQDTVELCAVCWNEIIRTKTIPLWISKWAYKHPSVKARRKKKRTLSSGGGG